MTCDEKIIYHLLWTIKEYVCYSTKVGHGSTTCHRDNLMIELLSGLGYVDITLTVNCSKGILYKYNLNDKAEMLMHRNYE